MDDSPPSESAPAPIRPLDWASARLLVEFVLDIADLARDENSLLDNLIVTLVVEANVAPVNGDPALQRRYGGLDSPPPDELRRPVSVSAVASSLGMPFETVRRRIARLAEAGACQIGPKGVLVPAAQLSSPDYARRAVARYERTRRLYHDLKAVGAFATAEARRPRPEPVIPADDAPVRLCNRLLSEYYLRLIELMMRRLGDPVAAIVVLGLARANLASLSREARAAQAILPETARKPVRRSTLAKQLGLPGETVRRRLMELEELGYCHSVRGGVMISIENVLSPQSMGRMQENQGNLVRFFARLRRAGLLDLWDAEAAAKAGG